MSGGKCIVKIYGGLGNQLFQIATGLAYSQQYGKTLQLVPSDQYRKTYYWNTILSTLKSSVKHDFTQLDNIPVYTFREISYKKIPECEGDIILDGYFQSSKYFSPKCLRQDSVLAQRAGFAGDLLLDLIQLPTNIILPTIKKNTVIVHARRGDYLSEQNAKIHGPLPPTYYQLAIDIMKMQLDHPEFILVSDDNSFWLNDQMAFLRDEKTTIFNGDEIETLTLMSKCQNIIIANSTFSWWGAYLAQANNVIAPSQWFGPNGPQDWQDIYEDSWTIIPIA